MSKCIVCRKYASPEFECAKRDMVISLCEDHADTCLECDVESCDHNPSSKGSEEK